MQGFRPAIRHALPLLLAAAFLAACDDAPPPSPARPPAPAGPPLVAFPLPKPDPLTPRCIGKLDTKLIRECSGFAPSKKHPGVIWTHSDSGDSARLFAIRASGETIAPASAGPAYPGLKITGAENFDWEAVCLDDAGRLLLGDFGNNGSARKKLCLYVVPEPDPRADLASAKATRIPFHFCDQTAFPDPKKNHDAEALFAWRGAVYVFTKHWSDTDTELHRIDLSARDTSKPTTLVARFRVGGMVTDAAVSPSGKRLAVMTYTGLWVFALPAAPAAHPLAGPALFRPLAMPLTSWKNEALAFTDDDTLLLGTEEGDLFRVAVTELVPVK